MESQNHRNDFGQHSGKKHSEQNSKGNRWPCWVIQCRAGNRERKIWGRWVESIWLLQAFTIGVSYCAKHTPTPSIVNTEKSRTRRLEPSPRGCQKPGMSLLPGGRDFAPCWHTNYPIHIWHRYQYHFSMYQWQYTSNKYFGESENSSTLLLWITARLGLLTAMINNL